jgi:hypothetical protein
MDPIARPRDDKGRRLRTDYAPDDPYPDLDSFPASKTPVEEILVRIAEVRPSLASWLRYWYDHLLAAALRRVGWSIRQVQLENAGIEAERERLGAQAETAAATPRRRAEALEAQGSDAHHDAIRKTAAIGRIYRPKRSSAEDVLRVEPRPLGGFADERGLPDPVRDLARLLPSGLVWICTSLIGVMIGLSLALVGGFFHPDEVNRQLLIVFLFAIVGFGVAAFQRMSIVLAHRHASELKYLSSPQPRVRMANICALAFNAVVILVDVTVQREGLLRLARQTSLVDALSGGAVAATDSVVCYLLPLTLTLGYVAYAAWEGYLKGRSDVVMTIIEHARDESFHTDREQHTQKPEVRIALAAVLRAEELDRQAADQRRCLAEAVRPFEERIARLEARRRLYPGERTPEQRELIQDAVDRVRDVSRRFIRRLEREIVRLDRRRSWWTRLLSWRSRGDETHRPALSIGHRTGRVQMSEPGFDVQAERNGKDQAARLSSIH